MILSKFHFVIPLLLFSLPFLLGQPKRDFLDGVTYKNGTLIDVKLPFNEQHIYKGSEPKFFAIDLSSLKPDTDISIAAIPLRDSDKPPALIVSKTQPMLTDQTRSDFYTESETKNVIMISNSDLAGVPKLYVTVRCNHYKDCSNKITFEYIKEFNIKADGEKQIITTSELNAASATVVRLKVPYAPNANRIVIHVDAISTIAKEVPMLEVFINAGRKIPYTNHAENVPRSAWFEGQTLIISKDSKIFCTDCEFTMGLKFNPSAMLSLEAHTLGEKTTLNGPGILDGVQPRRVNTYTFTYQEAHKEEDFVISIRPQQGKPKLYINCDELPSDYKTSYWQYTVASTQDIVLTPKEHSRCKTETYYLAVDSEDTSVYSIRATYKKGSRLFLGKTIMGDVFASESIVYDLLLPIHSVDKVILNLQTKRNLNFNINHCRFYSDCPFLFPSEVKALNTDSEFLPQYNEDFKYDKVSTNDGYQIIVDPQESGCFPIVIKDQSIGPESVPVCAYQIVIENTLSFPVEYKLTAEPKGHTLLLPGIPKMESVKEGATKHFKMVVVGKSEKIDTVEIQLTKFSGDVLVYVSRKTQYPDATTDATRFSHEGLILFKDSNELTGPYYIGVYGVQTSSFSISAIVTRKDGKQADFALSLEQGVPQKGVLLPKDEHPFQYYKINVDLPNNWQGNLVLSSNTLRGGVIMHVNSNGKVPKPDSSTWSSVSNTLQISSSDKNFIRKGRYHIGVFVDWETPAAQSLGDITFTIKYNFLETENVGGNIRSRSDVHLFVSPLTPHHGSIKPGETVYFEAFVFPQDNSVTFTLVADYADLAIYISTSTQNKHPSEKTNNYSNKNSHQKYVRLQNSELKEACSTPQMTDVPCQIFVAVQLVSGTQETSFSFIVNRETENFDFNKPIVLQDGILMHYGFPKSGAPAFFYFYTVPTQYSLVTVTAPGKEITIYGERRSLKIGQGLPSDLKAPTAASAQLSSRDGQNFGVGTTHLTVPPSTAKEDSEVVVFAVYFNNAYYHENNSSKDVGFNVLVSSQVSQLYIGKPQYMAVLKDQYVYLSVPVYRERCTLLITMTTLDDGDPDLLVSYGDNERPTLQDHQFASISKQRTEIIEINNLDIYPRESMTGNWIIGVYGRTAAAFTLTAVYEDEKMVTLESGIPFEMYLKQSSQMHFRFYHDQDTPVHIKLDKFSGVLDCYITAIDDSKQLSAHLPNLTYHQWKIVSEDVGIFTIQPSDKNYCSQCLYLITTRTIAPSKFSIMIIKEEIKFIPIQNSMTYSERLGPKGSKNYLFSIRNADEAILNLNMMGPRLRAFISHNPLVNSTSYIWTVDLSGSNPTRTIALSKKVSNAKNQTQIWDGQRYVPSNNNSFYIKFENPAVHSVDFSFSVSTKEKTVQLNTGTQHGTTLLPMESTSYIYYSSIAQPLKLLLEYKIRGKNVNEDYVAEGLPVSTKFFSDFVTAGLGEDVTLQSENVISNKAELNTKNSIFVFTQALTTQGKIGKYVFNIENPHNYTVELGVKVYSSALGKLVLDANSQHNSVLSPGKSDSIGVVLSNPGVWYLWMITCSGRVDIDVIDQTEGKSIDSISYRVNTGRSIFYPIHSDSFKGQKLIKVANKRYNSSHYMLVSSHFHESTTYTFEPRNFDNLTTITGFSYKNKMSKLTVKFNALEFDAPFEATDEVSYHVRVCPESNDDLQRDNFCSLKGDCKLNHQRIRASNSSRMISLTFDKLIDGDYYVQVTAHIEHKKKLVRIIPYEIATVTIAETIGSQMLSKWKSLLWWSVILCGLAFIFHKCYKKWQVWSEDKGFELPKVGSRGRGYDALDSSRGGGSIEMSSN